MNKISNEIITQELNREYNKMCNTYDAKKILGTFVVGLANYGFAETIDEIRYATIYMPNFEDLCFNRPQSVREDNSIIIDIRLLYNILEDDNNFALELLYSDYYIINDLYLYNYNKYFYNNREELGRYDEYTRVKKCKQKFMEAYAGGRPFEAARIWTSTILYGAAAPIEECYHINNSIYSNYLWNIKSNKLQFTEENCEEALKDFDRLLDKFEKKRNETKIAKIKTDFKHSILSIMDITLFKEIDVEAFKNSLTNTEKEALSILLSELDNGVGNIIISDLLTKCKISRPVFKNVMNKMERDKIAKISNAGVKGIKIEILERSILNV